MAAAASAITLATTVLLVTIQVSLCGIFHPGRLHGPPICSINFLNGSLACFQECRDQRTCIDGVPWHLKTGFDNLGVDDSTVKICWEQPCTSTSCPAGYTCENHFWRRKCYRSTCRSANDCPRGMECAGWPNQARRCYPQPCEGFNDRCPPGFTCLDRNFWRRCYPDQCRFDSDCPVPGSRCEMTVGGRLCRSPVGKCDDFMDTHHENWHRRRRDATRS